MTQFHEGQEVEVWGAPVGLSGWHWRKAVIDADILGQRLTYQVKFPNGARDVFDAANIRAVDNFAGVE
jgi:hypothetical protein